MDKTNPNADVCRPPWFEMTARRVANGFVLTFSDGSRFTHPVESTHVAISPQDVAAIAQQWALAVSKPVFAQGPEDA